jgi:hypothetical protein
VCVCVCKQLRNQLVKACANWQVNQKKQEVATSVNEAFWGFFNSFTQVRAERPFANAHMDSHPRGPAPLGAVRDNDVCVFATSGAPHVPKGCVLGFDALVDALGEGQGLGNVYKRGAAFKRQHLNVVLVCSIGRSDHHICGWLLLNAR